MDKKYLVDALGMAPESTSTATNKLQELKDGIARNLFGMTIKDAIQQRICIDCKKSPKFYSEAGRREYLISGLCEPCFDRITKDYHD